MFPMLRLLPLIVGGTALVAGGVVHGLWTDRWGASLAMRSAADRLPAVPLVVGDWNGEPTEMDEQQLRVANVVGHLSRRYVQRGGNAELRVLLLCGRPGPLAAHRPEICYAGAGFELEGGRDQWANPAGEFWTARFAKPGPEMESLRIFWAWGTGGQWSADDDPRSHYSPATPLYKLYVIRRLARPDELLDQEPAARFLQAFLPELQKCLGTAVDPSVPDQILAISSEVQSPKSKVIRLISIGLWTLDS